MWSAPTSLVVDKMNTSTKEIAPETDLQIASDVNDVEKDATAEGIFQKSARIFGFESEQVALWWIIWGAVAISFPFWGMALKLPGARATFYVPDQPFGKHMLLLASPLGGFYTCLLPGCCSVRAGNTEAMSLATSLEWPSVRLFPHD